MDLVFYAVEKAIGSEIFVAKIPSYKIIDVAKAVCPDCKIEEIGIRPGEKLHEEMVTSADSYNTLETDKHYIILPPMQIEQRQKYIDYYNASPVKEGFTYNSSTNTNWVTVEELKEQIQKYLG